MKARSVAVALSLAALVTAVEYFFRHDVRFWMPTFGTSAVNDMVALALAYTLLTVTIGACNGLEWRRELAGLARSLRALFTQWGATLWFMALVASIVVLSAVDEALWGDPRLPTHESAYRNPVVWFAPAAAVLKAVSMLAVNGVLVPIAEEYLWRGQVQPRFERVLPAAIAVGLTATLFSLKHAVVDASWGRFLAIVGFGAICGVVARRGSWRDSAALHVTANSVMTAVSLALGKL